MAQNSCRTCHQAHKPNDVTYNNDIASKECAACHGTAFQQLAASQTKHQGIACATCHQERHKNIPACSNCHGTPHPAAMMSKFTSCGECHYTAHDLNNWAAAKANKPAQKQPAKEEKKSSEKKK
jgi:hypothetical protein